MDIESLKSKVRDGRFLISAHADYEAADENIAIQEICEAILNDEVLEYYPDTGRGESCLVLGYVKGRPIHVVCGWRCEAIVIITVYEPRLPKFVDPRTRRASR
jgi:hypothetical protein